MPSSRNTVTTIAAIKLGIFTLTSIVVTTVLAMIMGNFGFGSTSDYKAVFSSASLLTKGDDVRIAGITVGSVKKVQIYDRNHALVTFSVKDGVPLTTATHADIRFLNLVGDRYMSISQGEPGAHRLPKGGEIPMSQTTPALDLTALFNGFQPLFTALDPKEINELSLNLVKVLQGEGGTIQSLLARTASLTNTLADRDQVIGSLVQDLDTVLGTVDEHRAQFDSTIVELQQLATGLAQDRDRIGDSLTWVAGLADRTASFLDELRPELSGTTEQVKRVSEALNSRSDVLDYNLNQIEPLVRTLGRGGAYGSFLNFHICGVRVMTDLATTPFFLSQEPRCQFYPDSQYDHPDYGLPADWEQRDAAAGEGHR